MGDIYDDLDWRRRLDRLSSYDGSSDNFSRSLPTRRGNSVHATGRPMRASYFDSQPGQYNYAPEFRENYTAQPNYDIARPSNPFGGSIIPADIIGKHLYGNYDIYSTPTRTSPRRGCQYRNSMSGHYWDEWCNHSPLRSADKSNFYSVSTDSPSKAFNLGVEGGDLSELMKNSDGQIKKLAKEVSNIKKKDIASQAADVQSLVEKIKKLEKSQSELTSKCDNLASKLEQANRAITQSEQNWDRKIKQLKIPDIDQLNLVKYPIFEAMGNAIESKITEMDDQIAKMEQSQKNSVRDLEKKIKESKISDLDKANFVSTSLFEKFGNVIEDKITEMDDIISKLEQSQNSSVRDLEKKIKEIKNPDIDQSNFVKYPIFEAMGNALETKITEMDDEIAKIDQTQSKSIKDLERKIKECSNVDIDKLNFVKTPLFETVIHAIEEKITDMDEEIEEIDNKTKTKIRETIKISSDATKDIDAIAKQINSSNKNDYATITMLNSILTTMLERINELEEEVKTSDQSQSNSIKELDKKIKGIKVPDLEKLNYASEPMFEAFVHEVEKKITEMDDLMAKNEQTQSKSIKDLDKKIKDIKLPDLDKLNFASASMLEAFAHELEKKITEMDDIIAKNDQKQSKSIKDLDKRIKDIKIPELDKLKFASEPMLEAFAHELEKKITEMDDLMAKNDQKQSKSIKDLDKRIKDIKIPDLEKLNYVNRPLIDQIVGALDHKITEMDEQIDTLEKNQIKSSKDIDKKIKGKIL